MDFNDLFKLSSEHTEKQVLSILDELQYNVGANTIPRLGSIVVIYDFASIADGMIQMKPQENPIQSYITVGSETGKRAITKFSQTPYDGAIIVDRSGQILGAGVYLVVNNPTIQVPDGCGTRHKAAASFSLHTGTISVLTLSEETNSIRVWKDGEVIYEKH